MLPELLFGTFLAIVISPYSWSGPDKHVHPHVWIAVKVTAIFDDQGRFVAAKENWDFDYDFSAIFKEQADTNADGSGT